MARLRSGYGRLALDMEQSGVPHKEAMHYAHVLQDLRDAYDDGDLTEDEYAEAFEEEFYEPLYDDYDYDIHEDYGEEE